MRVIEIFSLVVLCSFIGCDSPEKTTQPKKSNPSPPQTLSEARQGFETKLAREEHADYPTDEPPEMAFDLVKYTAPLGEMDAYIGVDPGDGEKHPAIIWLVGGFGNSISSNAWSPSERSNDQSATTFRNAGIVMMYPSLRGGNQGPGFKEGLFGEVDDVIAAAEHLASLDYVDPEKIYLGGHSVGGTLALLVAESTDVFRAVFSLGPVEDTSSYGEGALPFEFDPQEIELRSPDEWLASITCPTFVFEGDQRGNIDSLQEIERRNKNPLVHTYGIEGHTHFDIIRPLSEMLAGKIVADFEDGTEIEISPREITDHMQRRLPVRSRKYPEGALLAETISYEFAVYYLGKPESDPVVEVKAALGRDYPEIAWSDTPPTDPQKRHVTAAMVEDVQRNYTPPDIGDLEFTGEGLTEDQAARLQKCEQALVVRFSHPGSEAMPAMLSSLRLMHQMAELPGGDGLILDDVTSQVYSIDEWRTKRIDTWSGGMPLVETHLVLQSGRDGDLFRIISIGMGKFGFPDVIVDRYSDKTPGIDDFLYHVCHHVLQGEELQAGSKFELATEKIQHDELRAKALAKRRKNASEKILLPVRRNSWAFGDASNRVMEISFENDKGRDIGEQQRAIFEAYFGSE